MQRLSVYLVLLAAAAVPFLQVRGQPEPPPPAPPMPPMLKQGLGNVIGNVLSLLTGHGPGDGKVYPFPLECEGELKHQCTSVLRVCHHGEKCNLECMAKNPPNISKACRAKHPCALSAEKLCEHVQDSDTLFDCLKEHKKDLPPECLASEPCLDESSKKCKLIEANEWGGGENSVHGPNGIRPKNPACECKENSCKTHLHHPFCRPCGPDCVNNPLCGYSKYWCSVADPDKCNEPYAHHLGDCSGPFPRFPYCEESMETFLETPGLPEAQKTRCVAQRRIHERDAKVCPPPQDDSFIPEGARRTKIRPCKATFSLQSFMRDIFHTALGPPPPPPPPRWAREGSRLRFAEDPYRPRPLMLDRPPPPRPFKEGHQSAFDNVWLPRHRNFIQPPMVVQRADKGEKQVKKELAELKKLRKHFEKEMTRERNEIDRERKVLKLEQKLTNPKSSWNVVNDMHLKKLKKSAATNSYGTQNAMIALTAAMALVIAEYFE